MTTPLETFQPTILALDLYDTRVPEQREALLARVRSLCPAPKTPTEAAYSAARKARIAELAAMPREAAYAAIIADIDEAFRVGMKRGVG